METGKSTIGKVNANRSLEEPETDIGIAIGGVAVAAKNQDFVTELGIAASGNTGSSTRNSGAVHESSGIGVVDFILVGD